MSSDGTKAFFAALGNDAGMKSEAESQKGMEGVASYATSKGFDVTAEDLKAIAQTGREMSEGDLDKVAGGGFGVSVGCVVCISYS